MAVESEPQSYSQQQQATATSSLHERGQSAGFGGPRGNINKMLLHAQLMINGAEKGIRADDKRDESNYFVHTLYLVAFHDDKEH